MEEPRAYDLLKSLGFPSLKIHSSFNHFDFVRPSRRIIVIGPMGSGKTEYSSRVWRDARIAAKKVGEAATSATTAGADRRNVVFVRSILDAGRFPEYPQDALAFRGGYERLGDRLVLARDSFELEEAMALRGDCGTWIIDEAAFFDERISYIALRKSEKRGLVFIFPTLVLNFRREIFNATARLLVETATDIFPLTAYCEHGECLEDSFYTYRSYSVGGRDCPALYFDPLIIVGGDREKKDSREPDYCTRCDAHHYLPGKEYAYLTLKPLGRLAAAGDYGPLQEELAALKESVGRSQLGRSVEENAPLDEESRAAHENALLVPCIAERALAYLYAEQNLLSEAAVETLVRELGLDEGYLCARLADNGRPLGSCAD